MFFSSVDLLFSFESNWFNVQIKYSDQKSCWKHVNVALKKEGKVWRRADHLREPSTGVSRRPGHMVPAIGGRSLHLADASPRHVNGVFHHSQRFPTPPPYLAHI